MKLRSILRTGGLRPLALRTGWRSRFRMPATLEAIAKKKRIKIVEPFEGCPMPRRPSRFSGPSVGYYRGVACTVSSDSRRCQVCWAGGDCLQRCGKANQVDQRQLGHRTCSTTTMTPPRPRTTPAPSYCSTLTATSCSSLGTPGRRPCTRSQTTQRAWA